MCTDAPISLNGRCVKIGRDYEVRHFRSHLMNDRQTDVTMFQHNHVTLNGSRSVKLDRSSERNGY